jgi:hypothetical protein
MRRRRIHGQRTTGSSNHGTNGHHYKVAYPKVVLTSTGREAASLMKAPRVRMPGPERRTRRPSGGGVAANAVLAPAKPDVSRQPPRAHRTGLAATPAA